MGYFKIGYLVLCFMFVSILYAQDKAKIKSVKTQKKENNYQITAYVIKQKTGKSNIITVPLKIREFEAISKKFPQSTKTPHLVEFKKQLANLSVMQKMECIVDYEIIQKKNVFFPKPVKKTFQEGVNLKFKILENKKKKRFNLKIFINISDILEPIPTFKTKVGGLADLEFKVPKVKVAVIEQEVSFVNQKKTAFKILNIKLDDNYVTFFILLEKFKTA